MTPAITTYTTESCTVHTTAFTPEESAAGQSAGQRIAVGRLLRHASLDPGLLRHRADGSPYIEGSTLEISISHCRGLAALGVGTGGRFGIDIETPRATLRRVACKFLSEEERRRTVSDSDLLRAWTVKEALYKAAGKEGINFAHAVQLPGAGSDTATADGRRFRVTVIALEGAMLTVAEPIP